MDWTSVFCTGITVAGLVAIALTTDDGQTKAMAVGAIAGLSTPLGTTLAGSLPQRMTQRRATGSPIPWRGSGRAPAEFSEP